MNWMILGATLLIALIPVVVTRLRRAGRTLDAIMTEHHERMTGAAAAPLRSQGRHRRVGRRPRMVRTNTAGYATHRRMSA